MASAIIEVPRGKESLSTCESLFVSATLTWVKTGDREAQGRPVVASEEVEGFVQVSSFLALTYLPCYSYRYSP